MGEELEVFDGPRAISGESARKAAAVALWRERVPVRRCNCLFACRHHGTSKAIDGAEPAGVIVEPGISFAGGRLRPRFEPHFRKLSLPIRRKPVGLIEHVDRADGNIRAGGLIIFCLEVLTPLGQAEVAG